MIPDRLQYFLHDFGIDQKSDQIWAQPIFIPQIFQKIQENMRSSLKIIIFQIREAFFEHVCFFKTSIAFVLRFRFLFCFVGKISVPHVLPTFVKMRIEK